MKKVLVVDDSKTIRTMCEWIYKNQEDRLLTADSAQAAQSIIAQESPDVVIVDYTLPDTDSYAFVSSIKNKTHVIMMGGTYAAFSEDNALASGAEAVIMKPFKTDEFFKLVDDAVAGALKAAAPAAPVVPAEPAAPAAHIAEPIAPIAAHTASVPPIGGFVAPASAPAPISSVSRAVSSSPTNPALAPATAGLPPHAAASPFAGAKRFNFPTTNSTVSEAPAAPAQSGTPSSPAMAPAVPLTPAVTKAPESETPKTPVPSISPAVQAAQAEQAASNAAAPQIDPAVLRAEVIAAVKSLLPAIVNSYLKKLIQAEVKPQLQNWVDTRVDSLIKKMNNQQ